MSLSIHSPINTSHSSISLHCLSINHPLFHPTTYHINPYPFHCLSIHTFHPFVHLSIPQPTISIHTHSIVYPFIHPYIPSLCPFIHPTTYHINPYPFHCLSIHPSIHSLFHPFVQYTHINLLPYIHPSIPIHPLIHPPYIHHPSIDINPSFHLSNYCFSLPGIEEV